MAEAVNLLNLVVMKLMKNTNVIKVIFQLVVVIIFLECAQVQIQPIAINLVKQQQMKNVKGLNPNANYIL